MTDRAGADLDHWEITGGTGNLVALNGSHVLTTDDPYGAGWNGSLAVPTKNAVYDKIESLALGGVTWPQAVADGLVFVSNDSPNAPLLALDSLSGDATNYITIRNATLDNQPLIHSTGNGTGIRFAANAAEHGLFEIGGDATYSSIVIGGQVEDVTPSFEIVCFVSDVNDFNSKNSNGTTFSVKNTDPGTGYAPLLFTASDITFSLNDDCNVLRLISNTVDSDGAYVTITNADPGEKAVISVDGDDADIGIIIAGKGGGELEFHSTGDDTDESATVASFVCFTPGGAPAQANFGVTFGFDLVSDAGGTGVSTAGAITVQWVDPSDATTTARFDFRVRGGGNDDIRSLRLGSVANAVEHLTIYPAVSGGFPGIYDGQTDKAVLVFGQNTFSPVDEVAYLKITNASINAGMLPRLEPVGATGISLGASYLELSEMAAPGNAPANGGRWFFQDNGAGKTQLAVQFPTGAVQVIAEED